PFRKMMEGRHTLTSARFLRADPHAFQALHLKVFHCTPGRACTPEIAKNVPHRGVQPSGPQIRERMIPNNQGKEGPSKVV
ncbi:MAG: hypothetical protein SVP52_04785, partial [Chloroflexota bacterium]|nr:hypothetical protein [Chloroflexota bacterium]